MRTVLIIDDLRNEDLCYELNNVTREDDDVVIVAKCARSAVLTLLTLAEKNIPIDIIMLDHDLGDGLDTTWLLNWILGNIGWETPPGLDIIKHIISDSEWLIHTSNFGVVQSMKDKITQIQHMVDKY